MFWRNQPLKTIAKLALAASAAMLATVPALAQQDDTIKIGMTSALTGPYNEFGEGNRRALELAVEQWNPLQWSRRAAVLHRLGKRAH
jgi:branched-chain amino acid transport system substrate-binding protein